MDTTAAIDSLNESLRSKTLYDLYINIIGITISDSNISKFYDEERAYTIRERSPGMQILCEARCCKSYLKARLLINKFASIDSLAYGIISVLARYSGVIVFVGDKDEPILDRIEVSDWYYNKMELEQPKTPIEPKPEPVVGRILDL